MALTALADFDPLARDWFTQRFASAGCGKTLAAFLTCPDMLRTTRTIAVDEIHAVAGDKRRSHLHAEQEWLLDHKSELTEKIERAFGQFDRGEFFSAEESQADMEKRKAAWLHERRR